jgi:hypothetical protein
MKASISSNFGKKQMAKSAKSPANSPKLFFGKQQKFHMKMFGEMAFLSFAQKIYALCKKVACKLLMKLMQGLKPEPNVYFFLLPFSCRKNVTMKVLLEACGFLKN